ncbi:hypothetical protein EDD22DRAFT_852293 [Suillus occidentalis]|nr:hypothetical protein EDD22DRAFT_852293 [Suillus occidentalis]
MSLLLIQMSSPPRVFVRSEDCSKEIPRNCANIYNADRKQQLQSYLMDLDGIDLPEDDEDRLFTQLSVDTVYASYAAAQNCVRQYTQLLMLLKWEEELWVERVEKARYYLSIGWPCIGTDNLYDGMRLSRLPGLLVVIFVLMVACGASHCLWEKDMDFRGLDRHRTMCKHYQKESKLAADKRQDWARESVSQNLCSQLTTAGSNITYLAPSRSTRYRPLKPITHCGSTHYPPHEPLSQAIGSTSCDSSILDVAMEDE